MQVYAHKMMHKKQKYQSNNKILTWDKIPKGNNKIRMKTNKKIRASLIKMKTDLLMIAKKMMTANNISQVKMSQMIQQMSIRIQKIKAKINLILIAKKVKKTRIILITKAI